MPISRGFIERIGFEKFKNDVLAEFNNNPAINPPDKPYSAGEQIIPIPGGLTEGKLVFGDRISADSVIADIIRVYP
jgi:hypothetical protein